MRAIFVSTPTLVGREELYAQTVFCFCRVSFGRLIYSSYRVVSGIIRKHVHPRNWN